MASKSTNKEKQPSEKELDDYLYWNFGARCLDDEEDRLALVKGLLKDFKMSRKTSY